MVTKRLQYRYDAVGNKVGMTDADGGLFTYTYDVMRRLTGVINPLGERTTYTYDLNGRRTSAQLSNGTRTSYSYDQGSRVQQIHTLKSNNSTVAKFEYAYDNNGRRTSVLEADGSRVTWTYDGTSQVTSEWRTGTSPFRHTFVYDTRGNRTLKVEDGARTTLVYDAANQLSSSEDAGGTTNYTYDANGNQHVTVSPGGSRTTQIWDYENRLVKTLQPGGGVSTMAYDADGLRVRKETPSEAKLFVWDDQNYLAETDDSGVTEVAYTTEPSTYGSTISHRKSGATTTYHFDALAAARVLTNASETVLESYNYTAFGTIQGTPTLLTPFLWGGLVGYYWDADLATQYIRARHYQPSIARWTSLDPIEFAGGDANLFRYVGNSPTSGTTERMVRLSSSAKGNMQYMISPTVLGYLLLSQMNEAKVGRQLSHDPSGMRVTPELCTAPIVRSRFVFNQNIPGGVGFVQWGWDYGVSACIKTRLVCCNGGIKEEEETSVLVFATLSLSVGFGGYGVHQKTTLRGYPLEVFGYVAAVKVTYSASLTIKGTITTGGCAPCTPTSLCGELSPSTIRLSSGAMASATWGEWNIEVGIEAFLELKGFSAQVCYTCPCHGPCQVEAGMKGPDSIATGIKICGFLGCITLGTEIPV